MAVAAPDPWYEVVAPYVVALVSLVGIGLSLWWNRSGSREAWQRDRRLDAYSELLALSHRFNLAMTRAWPDVGRQTVDLQDLLTEIDIAGNRVALLGPPPVRDAAMSFVSRHTELVTAILDAPEADLRAASFTSIEPYGSLVAAYRVFHDAATAAMT